MMASKHWRIMDNDAFPADGIVDQGVMVFVPAFSALDVSGELKF